MKYQAKVILRIEMSKILRISLVCCQVLLPGVFGFGLVKILTGYLHGRGKPHYGSIITICSLVLTLFFDLILIPRYAVVGAALATTLAYSFSLILTIYFFTKESGLKLKMFLIPDFKYVILLYRRFRHGNKKT